MRHSLKLTRRSALLAVAGACAAAALPPFGSARAGTLLRALRAGGLVIYFRHSLTIRAGQPDNDLSSCADQRNLTEEGRDLARRIGEAIRALNVPIGSVLASPYCRCFETAQLAFGRHAIAAFLETNGDPDDPAERARLAELAATLRMPPPAGGNTALVAHGNNLVGLTKWHGYPPLRIAEAEAVVFRPRGDGAADVLGTVAGTAWAGLT